MDNMSRIANMFQHGELRKAPLMGRRWASGVRGLEP